MARLSRSQLLLSIQRFFAWAQNASRYPLESEPRPVQKILNRRINSWRASIACAGFIRLSIFSRRSRSIAASSRTSRLRAFHFAYLPAPMPSASSTDTIQTVMSVEVTRSIAIKSERQWNVFFSGESSTQRRFSCPREGASPAIHGRQFDLLATGRTFSPMRPRGGVLVVVCTGVCFAGAHLSRAQEATSANLPDQFQTGEMIQIHKPKKKKAEATSQIRGNGAEARHCTCAGAHAAGCGRSADTDRPSGREKGRAQPEHCLDATKSKTGDYNRTGAFCGRAGSSRRACRKEISIEKTAATCCATGGGEHFGARSDVAFGGTIHGNHRAFA